MTRILALLVIGCGSSADDRASPDADDDVDAGRLVDASVGDGDDDAVRDAGRDASAPEPGGECRSSDDCTDGLQCVGPEENVCGTRGQEECSFNMDCTGEPGTDFRCHSQPDPCSRDGMGSVCGEACQPTTCGVGFICQAGGCVPQRCNDGFQCSRFEECKPSSIDSAAPAHALGHGCVPIACTGDDECPDGAVCVNDRCQSEVGSCSLPPP